MPYESQLIYMPINSFRELVLHSTLHSDIKICTGVQPINQFLRLHIRNISDHIIHVVDRMNLLCSQSRESDD